MICRWRNFQNELGIRYVFDKVQFFHKTQHSIFCFTVSPLHSKNCLLYKNTVAPLGLGLFQTGSFIDTSLLPCLISNLPSTAQFVPMSQSNQANSTPARIGDVSVVLLQHWASMIDGLREASAKASRAAEIAQHQVHVLHRHNYTLEGELYLHRQRAEIYERQLRQLVDFTHHAVMWIPDINEEHFVTQSLNRLINEFNEEHTIDLTASDTESDEE